MKVPGTAILLLAVLSLGCQEVPVPSEILRADGQEQALWRAGVALYFGSDYQTYLNGLKDARRKAAREKLRLGWFRDYSVVRAELNRVLDEGEGLLEKLEAFKRGRTDSLERESASVRERIGTLSEITLFLGERGEGRRKIAQAGVLLMEAESLIERGEFEAARERLNRSETALGRAEAAVLGHISRYLDEKELRTWRKWAEETIAESKRRNGLAIVVSKLEKRLTVYRSGSPVRIYTVGLGINGLLTKTMSGDDATPEGRYRIVVKNPRSQYHKSLLIDYPNAEDRKRFARAQQEGLVPKGATMGGDIAIHGGGREILTLGCVSMDDGEIDELYALVKVGTPVTIVGTTETENFVLRALGKDSGRDAE